jgi:putative hydrolase of the HAD superfamily
MQRAIIFDFGGVIMKTRDYSPRHAWDKRLGLPQGRVDAVVHGSGYWQQAQLGQITVNDYWAAVARDLKLGPADVQRLAQDFFSGDQLDRTIIELIKGWRSDGHVTALLSNDSPALAAKLVELGIDGLFDETIISGNTGFMKPDPRAYQAKLDRLQRPSGECIFIDDMAANISGAAALGIHAVLYRNGMDLNAALAPLLRMSHD